MQISTIQEQNVLLDTHIVGWRDIDWQLKRIVASEKKDFVVQVVKLYSYKSRPFFRKQGKV